MKTYEWESIDESLYEEAGEKEIVQVSNKEYWLDMCAQNKRVIKYLNKKYPDRKFRTKDCQHDFGQYQEILEKVSYEEDEEDED